LNAVSHLILSFRPSSDPIGQQLGERWDCDDVLPRKHIKR
jgi:hypothetical protein